MSAICRLCTGNDDVPLWTRFEEGDQTLFESNYLLPILWLAMYCEKNLVVWLDPDGARGED